MSKNYSCEHCDKHYKSYMGYWLHNKKKHNKNITDETIILPVNVEPIVTNDKKKSYQCRKCDKKLSCKQSRWKHEKTCQAIKTQIKDEKYEQFEKRLEKLEKTPNIINNTTNNNSTTNNTTNNIQYIINSPEASSIGHLTFELQKDILDKGLNSLVYLIEMINFNKSVPENHSYCITAINDKHASVIDEKTNTIVKTNKFDLFDKVLGANLNNLEKIASNPKFTKEEKAEYKSKIEYLKKSMFQNNKFIKRYQSDINLMSYNKKDMVQETWKCLKPVDEIPEEEQPKGFDDLIAELPDNEKPDWLKPKPNSKTKSKLIDISDSEDSTLSSDSESESDEINQFLEIIISGKTYILEDNKVYMKTDTNTKGKLFGTYTNGKIKKIQLNKNIDL